tara:strand:- start:129 stop:725 length:597 start_codon:yes stop_codon:yes gene_type:complete
MRTKKQRILSEAKSDLELAVTKSLCQAPLRPQELEELLAISEADLMRDYDCDLYMAEKVKSHTKNEQYRMRSQNLYTPEEETSGLYPEKPYTRTNPINEDHHQGGRMLDYGSVTSDSHEGRMARGSLRNIAVDAFRLHQLLDDKDDLPQWCEYKIAQSQVMMNSVREYLEYKLERMGEDLVGELEILVDDETESDFNV